MKVERIFEVDNSINLKGILESLFAEKIDKTIEAFYSTSTDNHTTSSVKGDVI